jgi:DNA-binding HxlR family transcriptional regulator
VRELLLGPKRFTDLRAGIPAASSDMLSQRLRELQQAGLVERDRLAPPAGSWIYRLTPWGAELEPVVTQLARWSSRSPGLRRDAALGVDSLVLSLRALFDPSAARGLDALVGLRIEGQDFQVRVAGERIDVLRGRPDRAAAILETDTGTFATLIRNGRDLDEARDAGDLALEGDRELAARFLRLFPLPEPASSPG